MVTVVAQISDVYIGGPKPGSGERFSQAIEAINSMSLQPDLVLVTGDLTHSGEPNEWSEFCVRIVPIHHPPFETGIWWMDCG
jgi:3',5'-cyclic AMP phosphodiesterase CpdA